MNKQEESKDRLNCLALEKDCKTCGESSEYAKNYGCPCGRDDCPNTTNNKIPMHKFDPNTYDIDNMPDY